MKTLLGLGLKCNGLGKKKKWEKQMIWEEVENKYGKEIADKIKKSPFLRDVTVELREDGKVDIPERDIELAYKDITGKPIQPWEWD